MKKYLIFLVALCTGFNANAQLLGSVSFDPSNLSQVDDSTFFSVRLIEDAIRPAFFLSRQKFQVRDKKDGNLYGLNDKEEFGMEISLGVMIKDGYIVPDRAIRPWEYNSKYETYKDGYVPVMYTSEYSAVSEDAKYDTLDISSPNEILQKSLYYIPSNCFSNKGLTVDCSTGEKNGCIIWIGTKKGTDLNKSANVQLTCYSKTVTVSTEGVADIEAPDNQDILGGIYVSPVTTGIGVIELHICGILMDNNGKWSVCFPFIGKEKLLKSEQNSDKKDKEIENNDTLTPVADAHKQKP